MSPFEVNSPQELEYLRAKHGKLLEVRSVSNIRLLNVICAVRSCAEARASAQANSRKIATRILAEI